MPWTFTVRFAVSIVAPGAALGISFASRQTVPTERGVSRPLPGWKATLLSSSPSLRGTTSSDVMFMMLLNGARPRRPCG